MTPWWPGHPMAAGRYADHADQIKRSRDVRDAAAEVRRRRVCAAGGLAVALPPLQTHLPHLERDLLRLRAAPRRRARADRLVSSALCREPADGREVSAVAGRLW